MGRYGARPVISVAARCMGCVSAYLLFGTFGLLCADPQQPERGRKRPVSYPILADTVEPLMIVRDGDPMAGGIFTRIVQEIFRDSDYEIKPRIVPYQRMKEELKNGLDWISYGIPSFFEPEIPYRLSEKPVFPFDHVAVTRRDNDFPVHVPSDLFGKTVILVENFHYNGLDAYLRDPLAREGSGEIASVRAFTPEGTMRMLRHARGDVVIGWRPRLLYNLASAELTIEELHFQDASQIVPTAQMHVAFSSAWSDDFAQFINDRLEKLRADSTLDAILAEYNGPTNLLE